MFSIESMFALSAKTLTKLKIGKANAIYLRCPGYRRTSSNDMIYWTITCTEKVFSSVLWRTKEGKRGNLLTGEIHVPFHGDGMEQSETRGTRILSIIDDSKQSGIPTVDLNRN